MTKGTSKNSLSLDSLDIFLSGKAEERGMLVRGMATDDNAVRLKKGSEDNGMEFD